MAKPASLAGQGTQQRSQGRGTVLHFVWVRADVVTIDRGKTKLVVKGAEKSWRWVADGRERYRLAGEEVTKIC